ncbi:MAG: hypothetical protein M3432_07295, partial [Chloroflexota bacterium]|nr:hypothetical protein [Chloroflexota bacterium]
SAHVRSLGHLLRALVMFGLGEPREVVLAARRAVSEDPRSSEALLGLVYMGRAGIQLRDVEVVSGAIDSLLRTSPRGGWMGACIGELRAGALALSGDTTGAAMGFVEAADHYRTMGLPPEVAFATIEALELVGDALGDREAMIAEAAAIIDQLRFETLRPRLDAIRARTPEGIPAAG